MNLDDYVTRMAEAHDEFMAAMMAMQRAYGKTQTVFADLVRDVKLELHGLHESNEELRRLILEQGTQIRELRDRLNGSPDAVKPRDRRASKATSISFQL